MRRGVRPTPVAEHEQRLEGVKGDSFGPALEAFAAMLAQSPWQGTATRVVIADHWARYAIVPWVAAPGPAQERLAHGRQPPAGRYGEAVEGWVVSIPAAAPVVALDGRTERRWPDATVL